MNRPRVLLSGLALSAGLCAQAISCEVSPNPAMPGQAVTLTVRDASGAGFEHPTSCLAPTIIIGVPNGPVAPLFASICGTAPTVVAPLGSAFRVLSAGQSTTLGPGHFYFRVRWRPVGTGGFTYQDEWVPFDLGPLPADLQPQVPAQVGQVMPLLLNAPTGVNELYFMAASLTCNQGISGGPTLFVSLDYDFVFQLSFPNPVVGLFDNFIGVLDSSGQASATVTLPNVPSLARLPLHLQAVVAPVVGSPFVSNVLNLCIPP